MNLVKKHPESRKLTPEEALITLTEADLSQREYKIIRSMTKKAGHQLYPLYEKVDNL